MAHPPADPLTVAIAHRLGAEIDRQTYSHYRKDLLPHAMSSVLVDGELDLIELARVAMKAVAELRSAATTPLAQKAAETNHAERPRR